MAPSTVYNDVTPSYSLPRVNVAERSKLGRMMLMTDRPGQCLWERVKRGTGKSISPLIPKKKRISIVYREIISLTRDKKILEIDRK